jgi:hypothetical protein
MPWVAVRAPNPPESGSEYDYYPYAISVLLPITVQIFSIPPNATQTVQKWLPVLTLANVSRERLEVILSLPESQKTSGLLRETCFIQVNIHVSNDGQEKKVLS